MTEGPTDRPTLQQQLAEKEKRQQESQRVSLRVQLVNILHVVVWAIRVRVSKQTPPNDPTKWN
mgnify:CR=1 FL=1